MSMNKAGLEVKAGIAVLKFDNPPVNSLGLELRQAIVDGIERANADPKVEAIILIGAGAGFSGGADIREFGTPKASTQPHLMTVISTVEGSAKRVIAAINGVCMGGGRQLALGCHYRIAAAGAKIALPEVKLGLLPGAGGTQRLPRLIGAKAALDMITTGDFVRAPPAKALGLIDEITEGDLLEGAIRFAESAAARGTAGRRIRDRDDKLADARGNAALFADYRSAVKKRALAKEAPLRSIDAVEAAANLPFEQGLKRERAIFQELVISTQARALIHAFFAEREAMVIPDVPADTPTRPIKRAAVIGAGTMGGGIAMNFANAGIPVTVIETAQEARAR